MNMTPTKGARFISSFSKQYKKMKQGDHVIVCPSFLTLPKIASILKKNKKIHLGSQDVFWEDKGNFTGEVSPAVLKKLGVEYTIIGHSERRKIMKETDEMVNKKLHLLVESGITPILCIGENLIERKKGMTHAVLSRQLRKGLMGLKKGRRLLIAYEPIWAISKGGKGEVCTVDIIKTELHYIKTTLTKLGIQKRFSKISLLYGGSVTPNSIKGIMNIPEVDGVLVGNASLGTSTFNNIVSVC